jgi:hypothetical protein
MARYIVSAYNENGARIGYSGQVSYVEVGKFVTSYLPNHKVVIERQRDPVTLSPEDADEIASLLRIVGGRVNVSASTTDRIGAALHKLEGES